MARTIITATNLLSRLFDASPGAESLSRSELLIAVGGRDERQALWRVYDRLSHVRKFGFIETHYDHAAPRDRLVSVTLTTAGKQALAERKTRVLKPPIATTKKPSRHVMPSEPSLLTIERVLDDILFLKQQLPSFNIGLEITTKDPKD